MERPASQLTGAAEYNAPPNTVAFLVLVLERAADGQPGVPRSDPAPNRRVLQVISGVATLGGKLHPTEFCIRPGRSALPCVTREVRQRLEIPHPLRRLVIFAKSISPGRDNRFRRLRCRLPFRAGDEKFAQPELHWRRRPLKNETVQLFNAALLLLERGDFGPSR